MAPREGTLSYLLSCSVDDLTCLFHVVVDSQPLMWLLFHKVAMDQFAIASSKELTFGRPNGFLLFLLKTSFIDNI